MKVGCGDCIMLDLLSLIKSSRFQRNLIMFSFRDQAAKFADNCCQNEPKGGVAVREPSAADPHLSDRSR